eukprot:Nitzschia sp. Nitz4//scaffold56_size114212//14242//14559//NITZ4_003933-RA/size114212-processed-gene-0.31-mRNA-1//1//CDS//3329554655//6453//frame0
MPSGHDLDEKYYAFLRRSAARMPISGVKVTDLLGTYFCPSRIDVLCSRGKASWDHGGSVFFRKKLVLLNAHRIYESSRCRLEQSNVVCRATGFVKKEQKSGMSAK